MKRADQGRSSECGFIEGRNLNFHRKNELSRIFICYIYIDMTFRHNGYFSICNINFEKSINSVFFVNAY